MEIRRVSSQWDDDYVLFDYRNQPVAKLVCTRWRNWWPLGVMNLPLRKTPFTTLEDGLDFLYQLADEFAAADDVPTNMTEIIMRAAARGAQREKK